MNHNNNNNNIPSDSDKSNTNLKQQYLALKQKIANLEKNNLEMMEIYKAEEERLKKSNEFLQKKNNKDHSRTLQDLESEVLKMRNSVQQLKKIIEERSNKNPNLIESDITTKNDKNNLLLNNLTEKKAKEEYLENYKKKLKKEFEQKLIMKHKELLDYYIEKNRKIKLGQGNEDEYVNIDEIKNFTIKEKTPENNEQVSKNFKTVKSLNNNLEDIIKKINETVSRETKEIEIDNINKIFCILCMKEEYPKDFFINYILDEAYSEEHNLNQEDSFTNLLELEREGQREPENEIQQFIQKKPKRKSVFHMSVGLSGVSINKIAIKICKLFDIKNEQDIGRIKNYLNKIISLNNNLRHYFKNNLNYRFVPYEENEKKQYDEKIKKLFEKDILKITNLLNFDDNIISMEIFEEFNKTCFNYDELSDDFIYYMLSTMKLTKKQRKAEKTKRLKNLGFFEFYLIPLFKKVNN